MELELVSIGDSVGVILPQHILTRLNPEFEAQLGLARRIMRDRAGVLRELAKHD